MVWGLGFVDCGFWLVICDLGFVVWMPGWYILIHPFCRSVEMMAVSVFPVYTMSFFRFVFKGRGFLGFGFLGFGFYGFLRFEF